MLEAVSLKHRFYELCEELDVPYPKARYFDCSENGPEELPVDEFAYPLFAKPSDTTLFQNAEVAHKRKAYEIESPKSWPSVWSDVRASDYAGELVRAGLHPRRRREPAHPQHLLRRRQATSARCSGGVVCLQDHNPAALGNPLCIIGERDEQVIDCAQRLLTHAALLRIRELRPQVRRAHRAAACFFEINIRARAQHLLHEPGRRELRHAPGGRLRTGREVPYHGSLPTCSPTAACPSSCSGAASRTRECLERTLDLRRRTKDPYPLHYAPDTLAHNFWSYVMYFNQIRKFKRFFWDTGGKQFKE